jgi:cytochrome c553
MLEPRTRFVPFLLLASVLLAAPALAAAPKRAPARVLASCTMCHGTHGVNTRMPYIPRLAAQSRLYLIEQLRAFRDGSRSDPPAVMYMWPVSEVLTNKDIEKVATWYSEQTPPRPQRANPVLVAKGRTIFEKGILKKDVPACMSCHGAKALGSGIYPRLAGQNAAYLKEQLRFFRSGVRHDKNAAIMHMVAVHLSDREIREVAAYLTHL